MIAHEFEYTPHVVHSIRSKRIQFSCLSFNSRMPVIDFRRFRQIMLQLL